MPEYQSGFTEEIRKRKLTAQEMYFVALRQILLNQSSLLWEHGDDEQAVESDTVATRIEDFLRYGE